MEEHTNNGILYTEEIVSIDGASFTLFPDPKHTTADIKAAITEIRNNRDVVHIGIATEEDKDELYITRIFSHALVYDFRWYEINANRELIRTERKKGTTTEDYIKAFVIPFREQTKEAMLKKYGEKIINF